MNKKILIVDDQIFNLKVLHGILRRDGYELFFAKTGQEALDAAAKHHPDLILLDIMMPGMDGMEVCRQLKADPKLAQIPVIFVTSMDDIGEEAAGFELGAVDYITKPISPAVVRARIKTHLSLVQVTALENLAKAAIRMLGEAGHYNDTDTGAHIWRMADYARALAVAHGWTIAESQMLELAAPLHDTGKIGIPDSILKSPQRLGKEDWDVMMTHAQIGHDILSLSDNPVFQMAAEISLAHHEKWDGSGYPRKLKGTEIPESARIVAVVDVFDALTMKRPYKKAWSIPRALDEIQKGSGAHFDPDMVTAFMSIEEEIREIKTRWEAKEDHPSHSAPNMVEIAQIKHSHHGGHRGRIVKYADLSLPLVSPFGLIQHRK